jgi:hypothetical protein
MGSIFAEETCLSLLQVYFVGWCTPQPPTTFNEE